MRQRRRFAAMLAALALAAGLTAIPALATEGGSPSTYTEIPGDGTGSVTDPLPIPDPGESAAPPSSQEPPSSSSQEPTVPPNSSSSQEPSQSDPSDSESSSSQEPSSSEGPSESEPTSSEDPWGGESSSELSSEEPVIEPTEEPWQPSDSQSSDPYQGGTTTDATVPPVQEPETIATPRPAVERPEVSLNTGDDDSSAAEEDSGPNYVTFARLNVQGNSMAGTLFYSGVACIAVGVAGLVAILVLYLRGRRYAGAEGILEEIQEAENRQQPPAPPAEALPPAPAPPPQPAPGALVPEEASLYTEEFSLPPQQPEAYEDSYQAYPEEGYVYEDQAYQEEDYGESYGQYREDYPQDVYYEDDGDAYYGTGEFEYPPQQAQEPTQAPPAQDQATRQFDTEEILREALRYTDEEYQDLDD